MAITVSTSTYENYVNKDKDFQAALVAPKSPGGLKFYQAIVTWDTTAYTTGGVAVDVSAGLKIDAYIMVIPEFCSVGVEVQYNKTTGKIQIYTATASPDSSKALSEVVNGSHILDNSTITFLVVEI